MNDHTDHMGNLKGGVSGRLYSTYVKGLKLRMKMRLVSSLFHYIAIIGNPKESFLPQKCN